MNILKEKQVDFKVIDYLQNPPTKNELTQILQDLNISAKDFIRSGEIEFKQLKLANASEDELINAMIKYPKLIQRPIVKTKKGITIGRPPENILSII